MRCFVATAKQVVIIIRDAGGAKARLKKFNGLYASMSQYDDTPINPPIHHKPSRLKQAKLT